MEDPTAVLLDKFRDRLRRMEGKRLSPYLDSVEKLSIGYGRNIEDGEWSEDEIELMLSNDSKRAWNRASQLVEAEAWLDMGQARRIVLADMTYNMGHGGVSRFKKMIAALNAGDYEEAARQIEDSRYFSQVGHRAVKNRDAMRSGELESA